MPSGVYDPSRRRRGEDHWSAKLSEEQVKEFRRSDESGPVLARAHGVHRSTIVLVRARRIWTHV
jgi:hypothetical protein